MYTRDEIIDGIAQVKLDGAAFWGAFDASEFFTKPGDAWSPAENVRHLILSTRAVVKGLTVPRLALWWKFGRARRPSSSYEETRERYVAIPEKKAGRFEPPPFHPEDTASSRASLLAKLDQEHRNLAAGVAKWAEHDLDRYQLPHPLLGRLTVREMLFFTVYHYRHHMQNVERRRG